MAMLDEPNDVVAVLTRGIKSRADVYRPPALLVPASGPKKNQYLAAIKSRIQRQIGRRRPLCRFMLVAEAKCRDVSPMCTRASNAPLATKSENVGCVLGIPRLCESAVDGKAGMLFDRR